jgi:hypothetical protein
MRKTTAMIWFASHVRIRLIEAVAAIAAEILESESKKEKQLHRLCNCFKAKNKPHFAYLELSV